MADLYGPAMPNDYIEDYLLIVPASYDVLALISLQAGSFNGCYVNVRGNWAIFVGSCTSEKGVMIVYI